MTNYDNFISLGYFCSVAQELEKLGLRSSSSPFDWCITEFEGVVSAIENCFDRFLDYELLSQSAHDRSHYYNSRYGIWFFHDFDQYNPLDRQLEHVKAKYKRRIDRFYENIKKPTLFVRYISDEQLTADGRSEELEYIEKNIDHITEVLKSFNPENEIVFIANSDVNSDIINIHHVQADPDDNVSREPLTQNEELKKLFNSFDYARRQTNIAVYRQKEARKNNCWLNKVKTASKILKKLFRRQYIHQKQITVENK